MFQNSTKKRKDFVVNHAKCESCDAFTLVCIMCECILCVQLLLLKVLTLVVSLLKHLRSLHSRLLCLQHVVWFDRVRMPHCGMTWVVRCSWIWVKHSVVAEPVVEIDAIGVKVVCR